MHEDLSPRHRVLAVLKDPALIQHLENLNQDDFVQKTRQVFDLVASTDQDVTDSNEQVEMIKKLCAARSAEPAVIKLLSSYLTAPIVNLKQYNLVWTALDILLQVPLEQLHAYRPPIEHLTATDNLSVPKGQNFGIHFQTANAKYMLDFIDYPDKIWAPRVKIDHWAIRSLNERVHTGSELRPVIPDLLQWLADYNWPAYGPCYEQLARFPEDTIEDIGALLPVRGDAELNAHVLEFVANEVPIGPLWQRLKPELKDLVELAASGEEDEQELAENARSMLERLEGWEARHEGA